MCPSAWNSGGCRSTPSRALVLVLLLRCSAPAAYAAEPVPDHSSSSTTIAGAPPIPAGGHGAPTTPPGSFSGAQASSGISGRAGGGLIFEQLQEDYFLTLDLYNETTIGPVSFGLWLPLRFRIYDADPADDGVLRSEDWDEVSDYGRLLRFLELRLAGESWIFRGRLGALDGESLGHGTIVGGYYNTLDRDHYQAGLALAAAVRYGGVELLLDNFLAPEIFGLRLHSRPTSFFTDNAWANRLVVGLSYAADTRAPVALAGEGGRPLIDEQRNLEVASRKVLGVLGLDLEYTLVQSKLLDLVPYLDVNMLFDQGAGAGLHLGAFFNVRLPTPVGPALLTRLEYRLVGEGYAPRYVDALYEAQRLQYRPDRYTAADGLPLTKLGWLRQSSALQSGWLGELYVDFAGWIRVGGTYEDYQGPDNSALTLSLLLPKLQLIQLGAYYTHRGFDSLSEAFDLEGALLLAYARVQAYGPLYLSLAYARTWQLQPDGSYLAEGDWSVGAGVAFSY